MRIDNFMVRYMTTQQTKAGLELTRCTVTNSWCFFITNFNLQVERPVIKICTYFST